MLDAFFASTDDARAFGLFGGTALAEYYAGHRLSEDLDLFTFEPALIRPLGAVLPAAIEDLVAGARVERSRAYEMFQEFQVTRGDEVVRLELGPADPPQLAPFERVRNVQVASIDDLAAMKCHALCDRVEPRDAVDLWALVDMLGFTVAELEVLVFGKDPGLAAHPLAWAEALHRQAQPVTVLPAPMAALLRVPLRGERLAEFLRAAGHDALRRLAGGATP